MPKLGSFAAVILSVSLAAPAAVSAEPVVRGDVQIRVDLPKVIIRDSNRPPPRGYVRYDRYDDFNRDDRSRVIYDISGEYDSKYGRVTLTQEGNRVTGVYDPGKGGVLKGRIRGNALHYRWRNDAGTAEGRGVFYLNGRGNRITGTWGTYNSTNNAGSWDLQRVGISQSERWERRRDRRRGF